MIHRSSHRTSRLRPIAPTCPLLRPADRSRRSARRARCRKAARFAILGTNLEQWRYGSIARILGTIVQLIRIKASPETDRLKLTGKIGSYYGFTTPSVTGVDVIGDLGEDFAASVFFEDTGDQLWFADSVLEFLDHDPSLEGTIGGRRMFYTSDGRWQEV